MPDIQKEPSQEEQLLEAVRQGDAVRVEKLLASGANPNSTLVDAVQAGDSHIVHMLLQVEGDKSPNQCSKNLGLLWSAYLGHGSLVRLFLKHGADLLYRDRHTKSAEDFARDADHQEIANFLRELKISKVTFTGKLSDRFLEEIYDFTRSERFALLRQGKGGSVDSFLRQSFSEVSELSLRAAFNEYRAAGGKKTEAEVFGDRQNRTVIKPRLQ